MPSSDHTPRGHAARYTPECYDGMRDDAARTAAYRAAITAAAQGKVVVDLGTGALALLAVFAAEAGAKHVYAIEVQAAAAAAARQAVAAAGLSDRVTVLEGFSTDGGVTLPVKAELMVHELIGEVAGEEGVVAAIQDAARRHLDRSASPPLSIPSRTTTLLAPCEYPDEVYCAERPVGLLEGPGSARALKLPCLPARTRLAPPQVFEDLRFESAAPAASQSKDLEFVVCREGCLRGLALHVELHCGALGGEEAADVSSAWPGSHWRNILLLLSDGGMLVCKGDAVRVKTTCELASPQPRYTFEAFVQRQTVQGEYAAEQRWEPVGGKIEYPEASLNVNDAMDLITMAGD